MSARAVSCSLLAAMTPPANSVVLWIGSGSGPTPLTVPKGPKLPEDYQKSSTRHFMREVNRLGVTCGRPVASAVIGRAQMRAALDHLAGNPDP